MSEALVSIIIPVYNVENFLQRAICSVQQQIYSNIELILVNDGSSDSSGQICEQASHDDKRIVVVHKENGGLASARNEGIAIARGKYVFFLDADDCIASETIVEMVQIMEKEQCDIVMCGYLFKYVNKNGETFREKNILLEREGFYSSIDLLCHFRSDNEIIRNNMEGSTNKLYRRSMLGNSKEVFSEHLHRSEDCYFLIEFLHRCRRIYYIKKAFYHYYRYCNGSRTTLTNCYDESRFDIYKELYLKLNQVLSKEVTEDVILRFKHNFADRVIFSCISLCRIDAPYSELEIKEKLHDIVFDKSVIEAMPHYKRKPNNSWTVPLLIKMKKVEYLFYFARKIAKRRYS